MDGWTNGQVDSRCPGDRKWESRKGWGQEEAGWNYPSFVNL